jgi:hypothetical protein
MQKNKRCQIGASCGGSCIEKADQCRSGLGADAPVSKIVNVIKLTALDEQPELQNILSKDASVFASSLARRINDITEGPGYEKTAEDKSSANILSPDLAKKYLAWEQDVRSGNDTSYKNKEWQEWSSRGENINSVWKGLNDSTKERLNGAGASTVRAAPGGLYGGGTNETRGKAVLQKLLETGGRDVVGTPLRKWNREIELDHIKQASAGGRDQPSNWQVTLRQYNQLKSGADESVVLSRLKKQAGTSEEKYLKDREIATAKKQKEIDFQKTMGSAVNRSRLSENDLNNMSMKELQAISKGAGIRASGNRLGKREESTGEYLLNARGKREGTGTGDLSVSQTKALARDVLMIEKWKAQPSKTEAEANSKLQWKSPFLPSTIRAIDKELEANNKATKNVDQKLSYSINPMSLNGKMKKIFDSKLEDPFDRKSISLSDEPSVAKAISVATN